MWRVPAWGMQACFGVDDRNTTNFYWCGDHLGVVAVSFHCQLDMPQKTNSPLRRWVHCIGLGVSLWGHF